MPKAYILFCCLFDKNPVEMHMLVGADNGSASMNTHLGWRVFGRLRQNKADSQEVLLSLHVNEKTICDLWAS